MSIEIKNEKSVIAVSLLKAGDTFISDNGSLFLVISLSNSNSDFTRAMRLSSGTLVDFGREVRVEPVDILITIKG